MKTNLLAAASTLLLLFAASALGLLGSIRPPVAIGYLAIGCYMAIYAAGRVLAHARVRLRAAMPTPQQAAETPVIVHAAEEQMHREPEAAPERLPEGRARVAIGAREYLIEADAAYLNHAAPVFEPAMTKVYELLARGSRTAIDVGANVGCTALLLSQVAEQVHAFEPSQHTYSVLGRNLARAGATNISTHRLALGSSRCTLELVSSPKFRAGSFVGSLAEVSEGHVAEPISVVTLDEAAAEFGLRDIDFIKIDTEGFDGEVVRGALATLRACKPVVVLELNHWCLNVSRRQAVPDYLDQLASVFPVLFALSNDGATYLDVHDKDHRYNVLYRHMLQSEYWNLVGAFSVDRVEPFRRAYRCDYPSER